MDRWADGVEIPQFSLAGLGSVVGVDAIEPESLRTVIEARALGERAESSRGSWRARLTALHPGPRIDSVRSLIGQLKNAQPLRLGPAGVVRLVRTARSNVTAVAELERGLTDLDSAVRDGIGELQQQVRALRSAREADYAYGRGLLKLPSLEAPDISPALFGRPAVGWIKPVLYWIQVVEEHLPPGLDPRRRSGPKRSRSAGTTVLFPRERSYPRFLLQHAELDLVIGGQGAGAGQYAARLSGLTSSPAVYGKPIEIIARRSARTRGRRDLRLTAVLDHVTADVRDSIELVLTGFDLPALDLPVIGARLLMGRGDVTLSLVRAEDGIEGRWVWRSDNVRWERISSPGDGKRETGNGKRPSRHFPIRRSAGPPIRPSR